MNHRLELSYRPQAIKIYKKSGWWQMSLKSPGSYSWWVEVCLESSAEGTFEFLSGWAHWERLLRLTSDDFCLHGRRTQRLENCV